MRKIANTTELQDELTRILAYAQSARPSRVRLAKQLWKLGKRVHRWASWEGKIVGKGCRLTWSRSGWKLEELQVKGKKKLRVAELSFPMHTWGNMDAYIAENILQDGNVSASDSYEQMKSKIESAYVEAKKKTVERNPGTRLEFLSSMKWSEQDIHYLKVIPEGTEPIIAKGKDFELEVTWTHFVHRKSYGDPQDHDPSYTDYESSSAASARKLYQLLKAQPDVLKSIASNDFSKFLTDQKIGFKTNFSVWR